jgi:pyruvate dehydrogenase kinase 2/3/4
MSFRISKSLWDKIHHFASFPQTGGRLVLQLTQHWLIRFRSVSLQQMVLFGQNPSQGTLLKAGQFLLGLLNLSFTGRPHSLNPLLEELPIRLAHRVKELDQLPHSLSDMPSINKVKHWYAQSFEVSSLKNSGTQSVLKAMSQELVDFPSISLPPHLREALIVAAPNQASLPESTPNPSLTYFSDDYLTPNVPPLSYASNGNGSSQGNGNGKHQKMRIPMERR